MSAPSLPGRGLLYARPAQTPDGPGIELGCDCGTVTAVYLDPETPAMDIAVTCEGCGTSHWLAVLPPADSAGEASCA